MRSQWAEHTHLHRRPHDYYYPTPRWLGLVQNLVPRPYIRHPRSCPQHRQVRCSTDQADGHRLCPHRTCTVIHMASLTSRTAGTFNIQGYLTNHSRSLLLPDGRVEFFLDIAEHEMHTVGAPTFTSEHGYEVDEKGYGDEWYFKAPSGNVVAIGFRWGIPRLRGDGCTTVNDVIEFVDFLQSQLSET